ncbi:hypothetical protein NKG94_24110 [Micromonospora sp. M12]
MRNPRAIASARLRSSSTTSTRIPASSLLTTDNLVPAGNHRPRRPRRSALRTTAAYAMLCRGTERRTDLA